MREVQISEGLETVLHASIRSTSVVALLPVEELAHGGS